eukprot:scaffold33438_cov36-Phaeocystis_antarctica.AAC.1
MSPNLNARGLGLGETPLRRWGGYRGSFIVSVGHRPRHRNAKLSIAVHRLVLHRSAPPTAHSRFTRGRDAQHYGSDGRLRARGGRWRKLFGRALR